MFVGNTSEEVVEAQHRYLEAQDRGDQEGVEGAGYDPFRPNPSYDLPASESESETESSEESDSEQEGNIGKIQDYSTASNPTAEDKCDKLEGNVTKPESVCDNREQSENTNSLETDLLEKCSIDSASDCNVKDQGS